MYYDKKGDVLYLSVGDPRPAVSEELEDDVLLRLDLETGDVVGFTVLNFASRFEQGKTSQTLPVGIELHRLA